ncbi:MAG: copper chaperone PCu(A)C [Chloroflexi bacterium]|nr:copper chaperone PCu(A)C [Chloroflexota bacterium]
MIDLRVSRWQVRETALVAAGAVLLALAVAACGAAAPARPDIGVIDPWVRAAPGPGSGHGGASVMPAPPASQGGPSTMHGDASAAGGGVSAAYMTLTNRGASADFLVGVRCDMASAAELHESVREGDIVRMRPAARVEVPAGGQTALAPGGLHVMLVGVKRELVPGAKVPLVLRFERSGEVGVEAVVR